MSYGDICSIADKLAGIVSVVFPHSFGKNGDFFVKSGVEAITIKTVRYNL